MRITLKDVAVDIYVTFFLKETRLSYQEKKKVAKVKSIKYVDDKISTYKSTPKKYEHIEDHDWDTVKKYLQTL